MPLWNKIQLTEEQRRMYAAERLDNFRWIFQILARCSPVLLTSSELVPKNVQEELSEIGQFAELVITSLPLQLLLGNIHSLSAPGLPLEGYSALRDVSLEDSFQGYVAALSVAVFRRSSMKQIIVAISGTNQISQAVQDVRFFKRPHPAGNGNVHTGFWALYSGVEKRLKASLQKAIRAQHETHQEIVVTGHSMGGAIAYLLCIDLLSEDDTTYHHLKLAAFGCPRVGDAQLVNHFQTLAVKRGSRFTEYSVRTYNDGVPALPPMALGYRHFAKRPLYTTGDHIFSVPASESEYGLFRCTIDGHEALPSRFPRGGHNYYNSRDLERLLRRLTWLEKARFPGPGWEAKYAREHPEGKA